MAVGLALILVVMVVVGGAGFAMGYLYGRRRRAEPRGFDVLPPSGGQ